MHHITFTLGHISNAVVARRPTAATKAVKVIASTYFHRPKILNFFIVSKGLLHLNTLADINKAYTYIHIYCLESVAVYI